MFQSLRERLSNTFRAVSGAGTLSEDNIKQALRDVKMALLEADVNFKVVKEFTSHVREKCVGLQVKPGLNPGQQFVQFVHEELVDVMGKEIEPLKIASQPPTVVMVVGLQGSGKTTSIGKLSIYLRKQKKKKPLLVAGDVYRPAAIDQLETIGKQLAMPVYSDKSTQDVVKIVSTGMTTALEKGNDIVIVDTAGRLHIDDAMMDELDRVKAAIHPHEILLVVDAMTGQDAVDVAHTFHTRLAVTGVVLTKLDGDARGGAALSVRKVTGCPVKFVGVGEKLDALEPFHPDRMAQRILGMGDVLSLIEKVESTFDEESMAGKFHTELFVQPEQIKTAIDTVRNSYGPFAEQSAILIQEMISPDYAGVLFTRSPENYGSGAP